MYLLKLMLNNLDEAKKLGISHGNFTDQSIIYSDENYFIKGYCKKIKYNHVEDDNSENNN